MKTKYDLVYICTSSDKHVIHNLLASIFAHNATVKLLVVVVAQNGILIDTISNTEYTELVVLDIPTKIGLSKARNMALDFLIREGAEFKFIMFPDDDSTFDAVFFERFNEVVKDNQNYLIDVFCAGTTDLYVANRFSEGDHVYKKDYHAAMSVNMVVNYETFNENGKFDERLGVGARYGAAEDSDYFMRSLALSNHFKYTKRLYNFHPSPTDKYNTLSFTEKMNRFKKYGDGVVFMLCKHHLFFKAITICFRALAASLVNIVKLRFELSLIYFISFFQRTYMLLTLAFQKKQKIEKKDSYMFNL